MAAGALQGRDGQERRRVQGQVQMQMEGQRQRSNWRTWTPSRSSRSCRRASNSGQGAGDSPWGGAAVVVLHYSSRRRLEWGRAGPGELTVVGSALDLVGRRRADTGTRIRPWSLPRAQDGLVS